jgi:hypothetical protein
MRSKEEKLKWKDNIYSKERGSMLIKKKRLGVKMERRWMVGEGIKWNVSEGEVQKSKISVHFFMSDYQFMQWNNELCVLWKRKGRMGRG